MLEDKKTVDFGFRQVNPSQKTQAVQDLFNRVSKSYDLMNDLMSGGLHRIWKDIFVERLSPQPKETILDLAGGTGDIAFRIQRKTQEQSRVTLCDLSPEMLAQGRAKGIDKGLFKNLTWTVGRAEALPLPTQFFDAVTISFGLRNVTERAEALREILRVLKPGGRFFCLEFSQVRMPIFAKFYEKYSFQVIPKIGGIVAQDKAAYQYLVESIQRFPAQEPLAIELQDAGLINVGWHNLLNGVAAIHSGQKPGKEQSS